MGKLSDLRMDVIKNGALLPYMVNPYAVSEEEVPDFYNTGNSRFRCRCGVLYELRRGDLALIPVKKVPDSAHSPSCPLSSRYVRREEAITFDPATGTLSAVVVGDISSPPERKKGSGTGGSASLGGSPVKSLSPGSLIKKLNLLTLYMEYEKRASSINRKDDRVFKYYLTERFSHLAYSTARTLTVSGDKAMCGSSLERDGFAFFYRQLSGVEVWSTVDGEKKPFMYNERFSLDDLPGSYHPFIRLFFSEEGVSPVRCSGAALRDAMNRLNAPFISGEMDLKREVIIAAGWMYPDRDPFGKVKRGRDGRVFPVIDRLSLFSVNRYGVLIDSFSEARATEYVILCVNKSSDLLFYKPFIVTDEFYGGKWIPRGVVRKAGVHKDIVIEIYDTVDCREYMEKVKLRDRENHEYIDYFPAKEPLDSFKDQFQDALRSIGRKIEKEECDEQGRGSRVSD